MFSAINLSATDKLHHFGAELVKLASVPALGIEHSQHIHLGSVAHPPWLWAHQHPMKGRGSLSAGAHAMPMEYRCATGMQG